MFHLPSAPGDYQHRFRVKQGADEDGTEVVVAIEPAAVDRLKQFTGHGIMPGGSFWASRAEELLGAVLWTEGRLPPPGSLTREGLLARSSSTLPWPGPRTVP